MSIEEDQTAKNSGRPDAAEQAREMISAAYRDARRDGLSPIAAIDYAGNIARWMAENGEVGSDGRLKFSLRNEQSEEPPGR